MNFSKELIISMPKFGDLIVTVGDDVEIKVYTDQMTATKKLDIVSLGEDTGRYTLSKNAVDKLLSLMTDDGVEVTFTDKHAVFKSKKGRFTEKYIDVAVGDMTDNYQEEFKINGQDLKKALTFTQKKPDNKPVLTGVNVSKTHIAATDSFRMFQKGMFNAEDNITLTQEFVKEISRYEEITLSKGEHTVKAITPDGWTYMATVLKEQYPNLSRFDKAYETPYKITPPMEFYEALQIASNQGIATITANQEGFKIETDEYSQEIKADIPWISDMAEEYRISFPKDSLVVLCKYPGVIGYNGTKKPFVVEYEEDKILLVPIMR